MIAKILDLLSPQERRRAYLLLVMILIMALLDVVGVASIMPFMAVLADPGVVQTNAYLAAAYRALGFTATEPFLFFLGVMVFAALVLSIAFKAITTWALTYFTQMSNYSLSKRLVKVHLCCPDCTLVARQLAREVMSLPMHPDLTASEQLHIVTTIRA